MKKNLLIKILALILVLSFAFVLFAACNKNKGNTTSNSGKTNNTGNNTENNNGNNNGNNSGNKDDDDDEESKSGEYLVNGVLGALDAAEAFVNNINDEKINLGVDATLTFKSGNTDLKYRLDFDTNVELKDEGQEAASVIVYDKDAVIFKGYLQDESLVIDAGEDFQKVVAFVSILDLVKYFDTDYDGIYINGGEGIDFEQVDILGDNLVDLLKDLPDMISAFPIFDTETEDYNQAENKYTVAISNDGINFVVDLLPTVVDGLLADYGYSTQKVIDTVIEKIAENVEEAKKFDLDLANAVDAGLLPEMKLTVTFDLDADNVLEGIAIGFKMEEKTVTVKEVESFNYDDNLNRTVTYVKENGADKTIQIDYPAVDCVLDVKLALTGAATPTEANTQGFDEVNLINFEIDGAIDMATADGTDTYNYVISANVDPIGFIFVDYDLSPDKKAATYATLENVIKNMGYANISITKGEEQYANVLLKGDEENPDNVYVFVKFANDRTANFYFDITDLVEEISNLVSEEDGELADDGFSIDGIMDMGQDYIGKYKSDANGLLESVNFDTATGLTINKDLFAKIKTLIGKIGAEQVDGGDGEKEDLIPSETINTINTEIDGVVAYIFGDDYTAITFSVAQNGFKFWGAPATTTATATQGAEEVKILKTAKAVIDADGITVVGILNAFTK